MLRLGTGPMSGAGGCHGQLHRAGDGTHRQPDRNRHRRRSRHDAVLLSPDPTGRSGILRNHREAIALSRLSVRSAGGHRHGARARHHRVAHTHGCDQRDQDRHARHRAYPSQQPGTRWHVRRHLQRSRRVRCRLPLGTAQESRRDVHDDCPRGAGDVSSTGPRRHRRGTGVVGHDRRTSGPVGESWRLGRLQHRHEPARLFGQFRTRLLRAALDRNNRRRCETTWNAATCSEACSTSSSGACS